MHKTIKFALSEAYEKGYEEGLKVNASSDTNWEEQNKMRQQQESLL